MTISEISQHQREFRVECFEELLFTEGIVTKTCYCFNAEHNEVIGFDEEKKSIVSIDLSEKLKRRLFHVDDGELKQAEWLRMLNTSSGTKKEFLVLIITAEERNEIIVRFKISETGIIILNKVELNSHFLEENETISLLQCADTKRNFYLKIRQVEEESKNALISVVEIVLSTDETMRLKHIYESRLLDYDFNIATVHRDSLYLFRPTRLLSGSAGEMIPMANALLKVPLDNSGSNICNEFLYDLPSFKRDDSLNVSGVIGGTKNEIFYFLHTKASNSNILIGIDLNTFSVRQHFILNEHPLLTYCAFVSNNRIVVNGDCTRPNCHKWHTYHFVINEELIPDCQLNLQEISAILSPRSKIVYYGEARLQMILVWLIRQIFQQEDRQTITLYVADQEPYAVALSRLPAIVMDYVSVIHRAFLNEETIKENRYFMVEIPINITLSCRVLLSKTDGKFLIILNNSIQYGFDHPNEKINWIGMTESSSSDIKRNEVDKTESIHLLDRYYPDWETSFENDQDTDSIIIPPYPDTEKTKMNNDEGALKGKRAEHIFFEKLKRLRMGGILITNVGSKEFLKAHNAFLDKKFEIDALFLHSKYGIITFECKAASQIDEESLLKASKEGKKDKRSAYEQLQIVVEALRIAYLSSNNVELNPKLIHSVIIVPNSVLEDAEKASFNHKYDISIWDNEDLEESKLRARLSLIKENITRLANVTVPITNDFSMDKEKNFARITVASRSHDFVSPKLNAMALFDHIYFHRELKPSSKDKKQSQNPTMLYQKITLTYNDQQNLPLYLSPEQAEILNDDKHKIQIISGPPGTGKTLLMLLKVLQLDRAESVFKDHIYASSDSKSSLLEIRQFFKLNLKNVKVNTMPSREVLNDIDDPRAALFIDEVSSTSRYRQDLKEVVAKRKQCSGPTFLCVTSGSVPGHLYRETVEQQLEQFSSDNDIICTYLSRIYRGTQSIINKWWPIYEKDLTVDFGHNIIGPEVEEYEKDTTTELLKILVREIKEYHSSFVKKERTICAVITEMREIDFLRAFLASGGIPCGTVLQHVQNPNLVAVDSASECLSMEWPVVFYLETAYAQFSEKCRSIAYSRAIIKLVILKRDFIKTAELFEEILVENKLIITKINFKEFREVLKLTQTRMCKKWTLDQSIFECECDEIAPIIIRNDYWPHELSKYLGFDCDHFYEALNQLNENREARLKIVCATFCSLEWLNNFAVYMKPFGIRQSDEIPEYFVTLWKGQSCDVVEQRWSTCLELYRKWFETLSDFLNCGNEEAKRKVKDEFGGDCKILEYMAEIIFQLVVFCTRK